VWTRTPSASQTALAIAATVGPCAVSPTPSDGFPTLGSSSTSTAGTSEKRRIGYVSQLSLVTPYLSKRTRSLSAQLVACTAPPSIWFAAPSGLITSPASTAIVSRRTRISLTASTSATTAQ
jgi:hypothetical protein